MALYLVRSDPAFAWLKPVHSGAWQWRGGSPVTWGWNEADAGLTPEQAREEFIPVDCLGTNTGADGLILSEFARSKLESLLSPAGEFWPVRVLDHPYWWFNCLSWVEALDRSSTDADWSTVQGEWGSFQWITTTRRLEFSRSQVDGATAIFRVPEYPQGVLFGRDPLLTAVERHGLTGFRLDAVWSAERGGVSDPPGVGFGGVFEAEDAARCERERARARTALQRRRTAGREDKAG